MLSDPYGQTGTVVDVGMLTWLLFRSQYFSFKIEIYSDIEMVKSKRIVEQVLSQYLVNIYPVLEKQIVVLRKPRLRNEVQPLGSVDSVFYMKHLI